MHIYLDTIQFELTRRCNATCIHCCRGETQNIDLSEEVIDAFFDNNNIVFIGRLLLSGGEPTLAPNSFEYLVNKIIENKIYVSSFNFSINGLIYDEKFINTLLKLNEYCFSLKKKRYQFTGTFWISADQFHTKPSQDIINKYEEIEFFIPYENQKFDLKENQILPVGRALENNLSPHELDVSKITERGIKYQQLNHEGRDCLSIPYLYISSNGNVQNDYGSMYSYDLIDRYSFGNVMDMSLETIILTQEKAAKLKVEYPLNTNYASDE